MGWCGCGVLLNANPRVRKATHDPYVDNPGHASVFKQPDFFCKIPLLAAVFLFNLQ